MTSTQAYEIEHIADRIKSSDGELLWLARLCSQNAALVHLGQLTRVDAEDMLRVLRDFEAYDKQRLDRSIKAAYNP